MQEKLRHFVQFNVPRRILPHRDRLLTDALTVNRVGWLEFRRPRGGLLIGVRGVRAQHRLHKEIAVDAFDSWVIELFEFVRVAHERTM
jgi:hypothetical protein